MAQVDALFAEPAADLLRRPAHLAQLCLDPTPQRRSQLAGLTPYCLACLSLRFRLLEPIAPLPPIAAHLSGHSALAYAYNDLVDAPLGRRTGASLARGLSGNRRWLFADSCRLSWQSHSCATGETTLGLVVLAA